MKGQVGILNVGAGDTKLSFDPSDPAECIRAARIVRDMIRRGYALLVDSGVIDTQGRPIYTRAKDFDETKHEYIIADFDPTIAEEHDHNEQAAAPRSEETSTAPSESSRPRTRGRTRRVKAAETTAIAVSRSAGG